MTAKSPSTLRHEWIERASGELRKMFAGKGYRVPDKARVSIGWPKGSHGGKRAIGQCWATSASADEHNEIFISPELGHSGRGTVDGSVRILGVLAHEFVHAAVGNEAGHRRKFQDAAKAVGLEPPWTATSEGAAFTAWAKPIVKKIGVFPAGALYATGRKKQSTRLLKCECPHCGYIARVTRKWIEKAGPPVCPSDSVSMPNEDIDEEEGD